MTAYVVETKPVAETLFCLLFLATLALGGCANQPLTAKTRTSAALARAQKVIATHRQGDATIRVVAPDGHTISGAQLAINQVSHEFQFGCYLELHELPQDRLEGYDAQFRRLFNYATVGAFWDVLETRRGEMNWEGMDREVAWGNERRLKLKGHPLVWGADRAGTPQWAPRTRGELWAALKQHVQEVIGRYRGQISSWVVVNEPLEGGLFEEVLGESYVKKTLGWAREAAPEATLLVNEYDIFGAQSRNREPYLNLLKRLADDQAQFDAIGIQAHEPRTEWFDPAVVSETLDRYARIGKPIHITEFTTLADGGEITGGYRRGRWTPERQAEYWSEFFTICFGHPQVEAITVWGLDDARAWLAGGGLLDEQWRPKSAYLAIDQLINRQWRTRLKGITTSEAFQMRGFYGDYEVEAVMPDGSKAKRRFSLRRGARNEWKIELNKMR